MHPPRPCPQRQTLDPWSAIDRLIDAAPGVTVSDLEAHGVHLLAARHWRTTGQSVPDKLSADEQSAVAYTLAAPVLLRRIRALLDGPMLLLKGPEVAAYYPDPTLRQFGDLDLLVPDASAAQLRLLEAGFELAPGHAFAHQERDIRWPGLPLVIEIHRSPYWPVWMSPPTADQLFMDAIPSVTGVPGLCTLPRDQHALLLAAHSWRHNPLRRLQDLIDIAIMIDGLDRDHLAGRARDWKMQRIWSVTIDAIDALFGGDQHRRSWALRTWARHLVQVRDRTILEKHLYLWLGALAAPDLSDATRTIVATLRDDLSPLREETWGSKQGRIKRAVRDAFKPTFDRGPIH